ncbi:MAG: S8 family serine peptidase, partial [Bacteroidales bacterium]
MKKNRKLISIIFIAFLCGFPLMSMAQTVSPDFEDGVVYIKFKDNQKMAFMQSKSNVVSVKQIPVLQKMKQQYVVQEQVQLRRAFDNPILARTIEVRINDINKIDQFIAQLEADPSVEYVEKKPLYRICAGDFIPNDLYYSNNFNGANLNWHLKLMEAEKAWGIHRATPNIKVAVVDNAVWGNHPDLQIPASMQHNVAKPDDTSAAPPASIVQDKVCRDLTTSACPAYAWSHGTHCAGAVGAITNNGIGVASMGGGLSVIGVSCPGSSGDVVSNGEVGILWAVEQGAKIISLSWGNPNRTTTDEAFFQSVADQGVIIVAAAGNEGSSSPFYPAGYSSTISVASVNSDKKLSNFSNYGKWVDIAGPGGWAVNSLGKSTYSSIFSTTYSTNQSYRLEGNNIFDTAWYDGMFGTSMACPVVAGLCGFLLSYDTTLSMTQMREVLRVSSMPIVGDRGIALDAGVVNAYKALSVIDNKTEEVQNLKASKQGQNILLTWEPPKASKYVVSGYNIYKNGILLFSKIQDTSVLDTMLSKGDYRYGVAVVYNDTMESLRATVNVTMGRFCTVKATVDPMGAGVIEGAGLYEEKSTVT